MKRLKKWFLDLHSKSPDAFIVITGILGLSALLLAFFLVIVLPCYLLGPNWFFILVLLFIAFGLALAIGGTIEVAVRSKSSRSWLGHPK